MTLIADTGGLFSVFDGDQKDHALFLEAARTARGPLIVSPLVLAELDHLVLARLGREKQFTVFAEVEAICEIEPFSNDDLARARTLLEQYADLTTFDLTDASCVVLAERHDCFDILTTDQRDFRAVVGTRGRHFRILPYDG